MSQKGATVLLFTWVLSSTLWHVVKSWHKSGTNISYVDTNNTKIERLTCQCQHWSVTAPIWVALDICLAHALPQTLVQSLWHWVSWTSQYSTGLTYIDCRWPIWWILKHHEPAHQNCRWEACYLIVDHDDFKVNTVVGKEIGDSSNVMFMQPESYEKVWWASF